MQYFRSLIFTIVMYGLMAIEGILFLPLAIWSRKGAYWAMHLYCGQVRWLARNLVGLHSEIRGTPPTETVIICSKHQSFFDIILHTYATPQIKFVMKSSLKWAPILGFYAMRIGCAPVQRGRKSESMREMMRNVEKDKANPGQLLIYPEGTRVPAGKKIKYKKGAAALYAAYKLPCIPAATNVGVFWPRLGIMKKPGLAVVEYLEPIAPGIAQDEFMAMLEAKIEHASDVLFQEAQAYTKSR